MEWLDNLVFWHWWILAGVLLILELSTPVFFFLWLGFAAAAVGFLLLIFPGMPIAWQLSLFGVLSVVAVVVWRKYRETHPPVSDQPLLNQRGQQYTGRVFTLDHPIVNGVGKVEVTEVGVVKGKIHYMSPEQYSGADVDCRSDIYSLGATLYFMVTGVEPYAAYEPEQLLEMPELPVLESARSANPKVSEACSKLVAMMMQQDCEKRPANWTPMGILSSFQNNGTDMAGCPVPL